MKFYNAEKLFIGPVGYARRIDRNNIQFVQKEITVTRQKNGIGSMDYYYFDVLSNKKYIDFHNIYCISGDPCIFEPMSLALLIKQAYNKTQKSEIINSLAERVLKGKKISEKDIKEIVFYLNNHHKSIYIEETNEIIPKEKQNNKTESTNIDFITILTEKKFKNEPAIGRDKEVNDLIIALAQDKKNPILVGPSGTGKTTIADQLAYKIQKGNVPEFLKNKKIIEIDLANLLSGTKYSGTLEEKFTNLINQIVQEDRERYSLDVDMNVLVEDASGSKEMEYLSQGYQDLMNICRRFSLIDSIFEKEKPIIILDDPFINLDDTLNQNAVRLLKKLSETYQIVYLYCHSSRRI